MASNHQLLTLTLLLLLHSAFATTVFLSILKTTDHARPQYHTKLQIGTPPVPITLTLDVNNAFSWLSCDAVGYNRSSTYSVVHCHSNDCKSFSGDGACIGSCDDSPVATPSCNSNQCGTGVLNPLSHLFLDLAPLIRDSSTIFRRDHTSSSAASTALPRLPIACARRVGILNGLSRFSNGILSLSRAPIAIQYRVSAVFHVPRKFSVCLPSAAASQGAVYFGGGPYSVTKSMVSLPLVVNSNSTGAFHVDDPSVSYYVKLTAFEIDGTPVVFNSSFLSLDANGDGGALVSTIASYGQLRPEIFKPFVDLYVAKAKARNMKTVPTPTNRKFGACFDPNSIQYDPKTGSGLPVIDLVSEGKRKWRILGSNSVVEDSGASCLAFEEGKRGNLDPGRLKLPLIFPAVVIGGVQMEDNLVEFDAGNARLGVTSSLLRLGTSCSKFKGI